MADLVRYLRRNVVVLIVGAVLFAGLNWQIYQLGDQLRAAERDRVAAEQDRRAADQAAERQRQVRDEQVRRLADQVRGLGGRPVVSPPPQPLPPSQAEIAAAVARYLRENPPPAGRPPTMAEVLTAVTGYLRENPPPPGKDGADGAPGRDGVDGADGADGKDGADGADAPPPTDEQIRAAVEEYLATHPLNCPPGFHFEERQIVTTDGPAPAAVCVRDQEGQ